MKFSNIHFIHKFAADKYLQILNKKYSTQARDNGICDGCHCAAAILVRSCLVL